MVASDEDTHHLLQQTTRRQLIRQPVTFQEKGRSNMSGPERPRRTRESASSPKRKQRVRRRPKGREKGSACETRGTGQTVKRDASFFPSSKSEHKEVAWKRHADDDNAYSHHQADSERKSDRRKQRSDTSRGASREESGDKKVSKEERKTRFERQLEKARLKEDEILMQALFEKELRRVMREDESSNPARALRRRFRALSIAFHPDRHADKKCEHLRTFVKAQQALNAANSSLRGEADAVAWERTRCDLKIEEHDSREEERVGVLVVCAQLHF